MGDRLNKAWTGRLGTLRARFLEHFRNFGSSPFRSLFLPAAGTLYRVLPGTVRLGPYQGSDAHAGY